MFETGSVGLAETQLYFLCLIEIVMHKIIISLFTMLLGSKGKKRNKNSISAKVLCSFQTYRLYRKFTVNGIYSI